MKHKQFAPFFGILVLAMAVGIGGYSMYQFLGGSFGSIFDNNQEQEFIVQSVCEEGVYKDEKCGGLCTGGVCDIDRSGSYMCSQCPSENDDIGPPNIRSCEGPEPSNALPCDGYESGELSGNGINTLVSSNMCPRESGHCYWLCTIGYEYIEGACIAQELEEPEITIVYCDEDNDSFPIEVSVGSINDSVNCATKYFGVLDCDDTNGLTYPEAREICNDNIDNNCNRSIDEGCDFTDPIKETDDGIDDGSDDPRDPIDDGTDPKDEEEDGLDDGSDDDSIISYIQFQCGENNQWKFLNNIAACRNVSEPGQYSQGENICLSSENNIVPSTYICLSDTYIDACSSNGGDIDNDGVCGDADNCVTEGNPGQFDNDNDGLGNECDECKDNAHATNTGGPFNLGTTCEATSNSNICGQVNTNIGQIACDGLCDAQIPDTPSDDLCGEELLYYEYVCTSLGTWSSQLSNQCSSNTYDENNIYEYNQVGNDSFCLDDDGFDPDDEQCLGLIVPTQYYIYICENNGSWTLGSDTTIECDDPYVPSPLGGSTVPTYTPGSSICALTNEYTQENLPNCMPENQCKPYYEWYDYSDDNVLDESDIQLLNQYVLNSSQDINCSLKDCDLNENGNVSSLDILLLQKIINGQDVVDDIPRLDNEGEVCGDYLDNNCDGSVDENCEPICKQYYPQYDYNNDGLMDDNDIAILQEYILQGLDDSQICEGDYPGKNCDPNNSGNITTFDVVYIRKLILGEDNESDVCEDNIDNNCNDVIDEECEEENQCIVGSGVDEDSDGICVTLDCNDKDASDNTIIGDECLGPLDEDGVWVRKSTGGCMCDVQELTGVPYRCNDNAWTKQGESCSPIDYQSGSIYPSGSTTCIQNGTVPSDTTCQSIPSNQEPSCTVLVNQNPVILGEQVTIEITGNQNISQGTYAVNYIQNAVGGGNEAAFNDGYPSWIHEFTSIGQWTIEVLITPSDTSLDPVSCMAVVNVSQKDSPPPMYENHICTKTGRVSTGDKCLALTYKKDAMYYMDGGMSVCAPLGSLDDTNCIEPSQPVGGCSDISGSDLTSEEVADLGIEDLCVGPYTPVPYPLSGSGPWTWECQYNETASTNSFQEASRDDANTSEDDFEQAKPDPKEDPDFEVTPTPVKPDEPVQSYICKVGVKDEQTPTIECGTQHNQPSDMLEKISDNLCRSGDEVSDFWYIDGIGWSWYCENDSIDEPVKCRAPKKETQTNIECGSQHNKSARELNNDSNNLCQGGDTVRDFRNEGADGWTWTCEDTKFKELIKCSARLKQEELCGNNKIDAGEGCDGDKSTCSSNQSCKHSTCACVDNPTNPKPKPTNRCGDGIVKYNLGEECDDGNTKNGDGCSALCKMEDDTHHPRPKTPSGDIEATLRQALKKLRLSCRYDDVDYRSIRFRDVSRSNQGNPADILKTYCIVKGYDKTNNTVYYQNAATGIGEAIKIFAKIHALHTTIQFDEYGKYTGSLPYKDVAADKRYTPYIGYAYEAGILDNIGIQKGPFMLLKPATELTRDMFSNILKNVGISKDYTSYMGIGKHVFRKNMSKIVVEAYSSTFMDYSYLYGNNIDVYQVVLDRISGKSAAEQKSYIERLLAKRSTLDSELMGTEYNIHVDGVTRFLGYILKGELPKSEHDSPPKSIEETDDEFVELLEWLKRKNN